MRAPHEAPQLRVTATIRDREEVRRLQPDLLSLSREEFVVRDLILDLGREIIYRIVVRADHQLRRVVAQFAESVLILVVVVAVAIRELVVVKAVGADVATRGDMTLPKMTNPSTGPLVITCY